MLLTTLWVISTLCGWAIGNSKARALQGFLLGFFLSVLGLIIILWMRPRPQVVRPYVGDLGVWQ